MEMVPWVHPRRLLQWGGFLVTFGSFRLVLGGGGGGLRLFLC